jgi:hypothetical protein
MVLKNRAQRLFVAKSGRNRRIKNLLHSEELHNLYVSPIMRSPSQSKREGVVWRL